MFDSELYLITRSVCPSWDRLADSFELNMYFMQTVLRLRSCCHDNVVACCSSPSNNKLTCQNASVRTMCLAVHMVRMSLYDSASSTLLELAHFAFC